MLLIPRVQNKILTVPNKIYLLVADFLLFQFTNIPHFVFINGIFKTRKLKGSLEACSFY